MIKIKIRQTAKIFKSEKILEKSTLTSVSFFSLLCLLFVDLFQNMHIPPPLLNIKRKAGINPDFFKLSEFL